MADLMNLEELLNPFQATQNRLKRALAQAQGQPQPQGLVDQIPGMSPPGFPQGLPDQIPGNAPQPPQQPPQAPPAPPPQAQGSSPGGGAPPQMPDAPKPKGKILSRSVAATSGTSDPTGQPMPFTNADSKVPEIPTQGGGRDHWAKADQQSQEISDLLNKPVDYSGYEKVAKQKGDVAGNNLMLALLMQQIGDQRETGTHLLRQAMSQQGPQEFDEGMVDTTGKFVEKPGLALNRMLKGKEFLLSAEEKKAMRNMTADEKAATIAAAERRWQAEQTAAERRHREQLGATYAGQSKLQFHKGDDGQIYTFNPSTGAVARADVPGGAAAAGEPTRLPTKASADDKKRWTEATLGLTHADRMLKQIDALSKGEQADVGGVRPALDAVMRSSTQGALGVPNFMMPGNAKTRALQTDLARDAAMMVNQLYGAAVSKMEGARGTPFLVQQGDDVATVQRKLRAAVDYAKGDLSTLMKQYGLQGANPNSGGAQPKSASDYLKQAGG